MDAATQAPFTIRTIDYKERPTTPVGTADDIHAALDAAWQLNRHTEMPVDIFMNTGDAPRRIARVNVEWIDGY